MTYTEKRHTWSANIHGEDIIYGVETDEEREHIEKEYIGSGEIHEK